MNQQDIHEIVRASTNRMGDSKDMPTIYHAKRETYYYVLGYIKVDIDGIWHTYVQYKAADTGATYARHPMQFRNFKQVKP